MSRDEWFGQQRWAEAWERRGPLTTHLLPPLLEALAPRPGERILDVGTGDGQLAVAVARAVQPEGHVTAVDISAPVLGVASRHVRASGVANIDLHRFNASASAIPGAPFDAVTSLLGAMFFDDPVSAFANLRANVRSGGRLVVGCWGPRSSNPLLPEALLAPFIGASTWSDADPDSGSFSLSDTAHARDILARAGWQSVEAPTHWLNPSVRAADVFDEQLLELYAVPSHRRAEALRHVEGALDRHRSGERIEVPLSLNVLSARAPEAG